MKTMTDKFVVVTAAALVLLSLVAMAALHERHYKSRRSRILDANLDGLNARVSTIEGILREDRMT